MPNLKTKRLVRIWFSDNSDVFLPEINQKRLLKLRKQNPSATILLVVNKTFLSNKAKLILINFCKIHGFDLIDFDFFEKELKTADEKKLHQLAQSEIERTITRNGGNLGAASDIARILFVARGYVYSDFDTEINFNTLPEKYELPKEAPCFLTNLYELSKNNKLVTFLCNDIIAPTSEDPEIIHHFISFFVKSFYFRYQSPHDFLKNDEKAKIFLDFIKKNNLLTLFEIRKAVEEKYTINDWEKAMGAPNKLALINFLRFKIRTRKEPIQWVEKPLYDPNIPDSELIYRWYCFNKEQFLQQSVINFSGSSVWGEYIKNTFKRKNLSSIQLFKKIGLYSLASYDLMRYCHSTQSYGQSYQVSTETLEKFLKKAESSPVRDSSWLSSPLDIIRKNPTFSS